MPSLETLVRSFTMIPGEGTETDLGRHLAQLMGGRDLAVYDRGEFREWDPSVPGWDLIPMDEVERGAAAYHGRKFQPPSNPNARPTILLNSRRVKGIVEQARVELARTGFFNEAALGAAFRNIFLRVDGMALVQEAHKPEHRLYAEHVRPYDYAPIVSNLGLAMPQFIKFIGEAWAGCPDINQRFAFLGEYLGAAMLRHTWRHKDNPLFVGAKDTGKSVMLSVVRSLFPARTTTSVPLQAMGDRFGLGALLGASVNLVTELPAAAVQAGEKAKALLVGDEVMVEEKYKQPFPFRCTCGHLFAANELPSVADEALRERFAVLDFLNVVPKAQQDKFLTDKLAAEAPMIASWAIQAAQAGVIVRGQFVRPPSSERLGQNWGMESDSVLAWASDEVAPGGDADFVSSATLYASYSSWCAGRGEQLVERSIFGRRLTRAGFVGKNRGGRGYLARNLTEAEKTAKRCWKT